ncbi:hypothetical protein ACFO0S_08295 [Chryseomicrobium palamuruense]|uniref:Uncharacterized protein n=1 Tax=Chryseomicrobium palamuruense TaxID=682973 RepID=A0ABV8UUM7_9BACL
MNKRLVIIVWIGFLLLLFGVTIPKMENFIQYSESVAGVPTPEDVTIEHYNFFLFSTYTPFVHDEYGITHLGTLGQFFPISEGQFDQPFWLEWLR